MKKIKDMDSYIVDKYINCICEINNYIYNAPDDLQICIFKKEIFADKPWCFNFEPIGYVIIVSRLWTDETLYKGSTIDNPDLTFEDICQACNLKTSIF